MFCPTHNVVVSFPYLQLHPTYNVVVSFPYTATAAPLYQKYLKPQIFNKEWFSST